MKQLLFISLFTILVFVANAATGEKHVHKKTENHLKKGAAGVCGCQRYVIYNGYMLDFRVAYESAYGCDPAFATNPYSAVYSGGSLIAEGVPSASGVCFVCGVSCAVA
jgi:hypothetical protein